MEKKWKILSKNVHEDEINNIFACWNWLGYKNKKGYGCVSTDNKRILAHRMSYELHVGKIPDGLLVCHICDNPCCVNPRHLFIGSHQDNADDMVSKGRQKKSHETQTAKLNYEKAWNITAEYVSGASQRSLANKYGVAQSTISRVVNSQTWANRD